MSNNQPQQQQTIDLDSLSNDQLKGMAYDRMAAMQSLQAEMNSIQQVLARRAAAPQDTPAKFNPGAEKNPKDKKTHNRP